MTLSNTYQIFAMLYNSCRKIKWFSNVFGGKYCLLVEIRDLLGNGIVNWKPTLVKDVNYIYFAEIIV